MNNYDENANNAADRHARLMHESLNESVPYRSDRLKALFGDDEVNDMLNYRPLETKAIDGFKQSNTRQAIWTIASLTLLAIIVCYLAWGGHGN